MDKIQTFEQFLTSESGQFSVWNFSANLFLTALLAFLLSLLYDYYGNSLSNRKSFGQNFVMLAVTTMIIITIVKSSLALSLGLVGALSIVRFRAAIKEPEELTYLFLNIAIGLGFGADQRMATILGFTFIAIYLIFKNSIKKKSNLDRHNVILSISSSDPDQEQLNGIVYILKKYSKKVDLKRFDENSQNLEVSFVVEFDNFDEVNVLKNELQANYKSITISLLDNNINV